MESPSVVPPELGCRDVAEGIPVSVLFHYPDLVLMAEQDSVGWMGLQPILRSGEPPFTYRCPGFRGETRFEGRIYKRLKKSLSPFLHSLTPSKSRGTAWGGERQVFLCRAEDGAWGELRGHNSSVSGTQVSQRAVCPLTPSVSSFSPFLPPACVHACS